MALSHSPRIVTENLVLLLDAANTKSVPKTNILTTWVDYGGNQTNYEVLGAYSVKLKNTTTGWVGYFPATVSSTGKYVITFTYYSDSDGSSLVLDNDGIMDNTYNTTLTVNITPQTYTGSVDVNTTGNIQHFFRRNGGGNIYVTNVSYFKLETTWTDLSNNGNSGTLANGVGYSASNGGALSFDGVDDKVTFPNNTISTSSGMTVEVWFKTSSGTKYQDIFDLEDAYGVWIVTNYSASGKINASFNTLTGYMTADYTANNWYQVVLSGSGTSNFMYLNGVQVGTASQTVASSINLNTARIGNVDGDRAAEYLIGNVSSLKFYNRALSAAEIQQNYNALKGRFSI